MFLLVVIVRHTLKNKFSKNIGKNKKKFNYYLEILVLYDIN
jgi:hypothetical protein